MNPQTKHFSVLLLLLFLSFILTACSDDDEHGHSATIIPVVNPSFDSITSVSKSATADGTYDVLAATDYSFAEETITLKESLIGANGAYLKIIGKATVDGAEGDYTVYTFLENDEDSVAANELTTLMVAAIATDATNDENETIDTFAKAIEHFKKETGLTKDDMTMAMTAAQRAEIPNLGPTLEALSSTVSGTTLDFTTVLQSKPLNLDQIAWGALLYENWMTSPDEAPSASSTTPAVHNHGKPQARAEMDHTAHGSGGEFGDNHQPVNLQVMLTGDANTEPHLTHGNAEHEGFRRFASCKECHGWDQMGNEGSFANRDYTTATLTNPNDTTDTGDFSIRPKAIANTNLADNTDINADSIVAASGNLYANVDSHLMAASAAELATAWNAKVEEADGGIRKSDMHPDYTRSTATDAEANDGAVNDMVPSESQIEAMVAFLNYDGAKMHHVMTWNADDAEYTPVTGGHAEHGEEHYAKYCFRCHAAPNTTGGNPLFADTNLMGYITKGGDSIDGERFSTVAHVARWGKAGKVMTRDRVGYPSAHDVAGIMAYLKAYQDGDTEFTAADAMGNVGMGTAATGEAFYYQKCAGCHAASATTLTDSAESSLEGEGEDTTFRCHVVATDGTESLEAPVDGSCGDNHAVPNLGSAMHHTRMKNDLATISPVMTTVDKLTQQNINDLAAFFNSLSN